MGHPGEASGEFIDSSGAIAQGPPLSEWDDSHARREDKDGVLELERGRVEGEVRNGVS